MKEETTYLFYFIAEAEEKYGAKNLNIYNSNFLPMYFAVTKRKQRCNMKIICLLPDEKVNTMKHFKLFILATDEKCICILSIIYYIRYFTS